MSDENKEFNLSMADKNSIKEAILKSAANSPLTPEELAVSLREAFKILSQHH